MINSMYRAISFPELAKSLLLLLVITACKVMPAHTPDQLLFSMEKTSCMGSCPVYTLSVYQDGWAELQGVANLKFLGKHQYKLNDEQINDIKNAFRDYDYFSLEEKYYANVSDLPTTFLFYQDGEEAKKVMDYYGAPENLKQLEKYLSTYLQLKWKKSPDSPAN